MTKCANCDGSGLAGSGPSPWLHQGSVSTCAPCKGTGMIQDAPSAGDGVTPETQGDVVPKADGADASETGSAAAPEEAPQN